MIEDQKGAANAAKLGKTFIDANPSSKASASIKQLGKAVIGIGDSDGEGTVTATADKKSLLGSFDIKSLLAKKDKSATQAAK